MKLTKDIIIEGYTIKQNSEVELIEAFKSGSAANVVQKLGNILGRKIGVSFNVASTPSLYQNEYGSFAGFYMLANSGLMLRCNFKLSGSDSIESFDVYLDGYNDVPDYVVDTTGMNIIEVVETIVENLIEDNEVAVSMVEQSELSDEEKEKQKLNERFSNPEDVMTILNKWVDTDKSILSTLQKMSVPEIFNGIWSDWVNDKPNYKDIKYYLFATSLKQFLLSRGLTNKTYRKRKKGSRERTIEDPVLEAQIEEVVNSLSWKEKFEFLEHSIKTIASGRFQSLIVRGSPGSGKTRTVQDTLKQEGVSYVDYSGGIKSVDEVAYILYAHREDEIILFDDCDTVLKKDPNIWKAILQNNPVRVVTIADLKRKGRLADIPQKFEFTSGVIFVTNEYKLDAAIESRSIVLTIDLTNDEMIDKMKATLEKFLPDISLKRKQDALEFAQEMAKGVAAIDYRTLEKILIAQEISPSNWKKYALWMMQ